MVVVVGVVIVVVAVVIVVVVVVVVVFDAVSVDGGELTGWGSFPKAEKLSRVLLILAHGRSKTLMLGNLVVVASCGMERPELRERLRVWRLGKECGAFNN